eukprot:15329931-Ditylum_brightwellii.AAC.1
MIKYVAYKYETQSYPFEVVHNVMQSFYLTYQKDNCTFEQYMDIFLNSIDVIKNSDGTVGEHPKL